MSGWYVAKQAISPISQNNSMNLNMTSVIRCDLRHHVADHALDLIPARLRPGPVAEVSSTNPFYRRDKPGEEALGSWQSSGAEGLIWGTCLYRYPGYLEIIFARHHNT